MDIGKGEVQYSNICDQMNSIIQTKDCLNTITKINLLGDSISDNVKKEIKLLSDLLVSLSTGDNESPNLKSFKSKYVEQYGVNSEISLLQLFDPSSEIAKSYTTVSEKYSDDYSRKKKIMREYMQDKVLLCLNKGLNELKLSNEDITFFNSLRIDSNEEKLSFSNSFELNLNIFAESNEQIDKGDFYLCLAPCAGSNRAGKLVNRFYNVLKEETQDKLKSIYEKMIDSNSYILADTTYLPRNGRTNNVCSGKKNYLYSIDSSLNTDPRSQRISISDIYLGYDSTMDRLYLKSRKLNQIICADTDSMLNPFIDNLYLRFMRDVSFAYEIHPMDGFFSLINLQLKHMPKIVYNKIILQSERWVMTSNEVSNVDNLKSLESDFLIFCKTWNIPNMIYLIDGDRYLLFDIRNTLTRNCLIKEMKRILKLSNKVTIAVAEGVNKCWLQDIKKSGKYFAEITSELTLKNGTSNHIGQVFDEILSTNSNISKNKCDVDLFDKKRFCTPGYDGWIYFKIYLDREKLNELIERYLYDLANDLLSKNEVKQLFFIRYADPNFHVRLRVKAVTSSDTTPLFGYFMHIFDEIIASGLSYRYSLNVYEKEIERYGGTDALNVAEEVFYWDSMLVLQLIAFKERKILSIEEDIIGVLCLFDIITSFTINFIQAEMFLNNLVSPNEHLEEFKKYKESLISYFSKMSSDFSVFDASTLEILNQRKNALYDYKKIIDQLDNEGNLSNTKTDILSTLIHMFCNRFNGDRAWERKIIAMTRHTIHSINSKNKFLNKLEKKDE